MKVGYIRCYLGSNKGHVNYHVLHDGNNYRVKLNKKNITGSFFQIQSALSEFYIKNKEFRVEKINIDITSNQFSNNLPEDGEIIKETIDEVNLKAIENPENTIDDYENYNKDELNYEEENNSKERLNEKYSSKNYNEFSLINDGDDLFIKLIKNSITLFLGFFVSIFLAIFYLLLGIFIKRYQSVAFNYIWRGFLNLIILSLPFIIYKIFTML